MDYDTIVSEINITLKKIDGLFDGFYKWFAGQYDRETGGFYYAPSSVELVEFQPDIESTAQAVHILIGSGLIKTIPPTMKAKLIQFFQSRQNPVTGYFYDPQNEMRKVYRMVGRAVLYTKNCLEVLGGETLYPFPGEHGTQNLPEYFNSPGTYRQWLENLNWQDPWMAGDAIQVSGAYLRQLPQEVGQSYLEQALVFLKEKQNDSTGLWGMGEPFHQVSGAFKIALFFTPFSRPIPNAELIYNSLLDCLRTQIPIDMCFVRNPIDLLKSLKPQLKEIPKNELAEIMMITQKNLMAFKRPDGGFSRLRDRSPAAPNEVVLGKGLCEGDMNAGTQALRIRNYCYDLAGKKWEALTGSIGDFINL